MIVKFKEEIKSLSGIDLICLRGTKETELKEIELEMLRRIKDEE